jgi:hypothetical protein
VYDNFNPEINQLADNLTSSIAALNQFFSELLLTPSDQDELWRKRGLTLEECSRAGFKTNDQCNRDILVNLSTRFSQEVLTESGLWVRGPGGEAKPNSQFYGYGLIARKGGPEGSEVWGWKHDGKCNPVLIPYWDAQGRLFHLRPHKGGIAGKPPHLYVARSEGICDTPCAMAIITEGEFKARALHAVLNSIEPQKFSVAALPGISMAKNRGCLNELFNWLKAITPTRIVIAYDSEDKGDPRLPAFKANPRKRHDAQIWARYLANLMNREGYDTVVGVLPKAWRDPKNGKTDWDSRLAARINDLSQTLVT